jgi:hypothetical protein
MKATLYFTEHGKWVDVSFTSEKSLTDALKINPGVGQWWGCPIWVFNHKGTLIGKHKFVFAPWWVIGRNIYRLCKK